MIHEDVRLEITSLRCAGDGRELTLEELGEMDGSCPSCKTDRFDAMVHKASTGTDLNEFLDRETRMSAVVHGRWNQQREFDLEQVSGQDLVAWMKLPTEEALARMHEHRVARAKMKLAAGQDLCPTCDTIFTPASSDTSLVKYCSMACKTMGEKGIKGTSGTPLQRPTSGWHSKKLTFKAALSLGLIVATLLFWIGRYRPSPSSEVPTAAVMEANVFLLALVKGKAREEFPNVILPYPDLNGGIQSSRVSFSGPTLELDTVAVNAQIITSGGREMDLVILLKEKGREWNIFSVMAVER